MIAAISSRRPTSGVGGKLLLRRCQPRLLAQDRALELLQPRAGLDPELVDQDAPCLPTCLERLVLTSRAVESEDLLLAEPFPIGVLGDERFQRRRQAVVPAAGELGLIRELDGREAELLEALRLGRRRRISRQVGQRRPAPERQGRAQAARGHLRVSGCECPPPTFHFPFEACEVELGVVERDAVARSRGLDSRRPQRPAQLVDVDLKGLDRRRRRVASPEAVHEPIP